VKVQKKTAPRPRVISILTGDKMNWIFTLDRSSLRCKPMFYRSNTTWQTHGMNQ
jgi:hypothetical protein